tara:strand:- start:127 stop:300 length:174 start_codon:yes stop_codon:yes gene_type:complete
MESVRLEPEWVGMFEYAVQIVKDEVPVDRGQEFLINMLDFGKKLYGELERLDHSVGW